MAHLESNEEIRTRIAQTDAHRQAEIDAKLAEFNKRVTAPLAAKKAVDKAEQQERVEALEQQRSEALDKRRREQALAAWRRAGGSVSAFDAQWPEMREKLLVEESLKEHKRADQWRKAAARRYR